jgi:hypothetical protein
MHNIANSNFLTSKLYRRKIPVATAIYLSKELLTSIDKLSDECSIEDALTEVAKLLISNN